MWVDNESEVVELFGSAKVIRLAGLKIHMVQFRKNDSYKQPYFEA